ncbi:MAG: hypothetical protein HGA45_14835 [Chloroflexales bacterium]|nr:hypothetical protein [Chloroflexales bacterium]
MGTYTVADRLPLILARWLLITLMLVALAAHPWLSQAAGRTWVNIGPEGGAVSRLLVVPQTPTTIYALVGASDYGETVYRSTDGGLSWIRASAGLRGRQIFDLALDPLTPARLFAATDDGIYRTANGGVSWSWLPGGPSNATHVAVAPSSPEVVYATSGWIIYRSADTGATWDAGTEYSSSLSSAAALAVDPSNANVVYAGTIEGLAKSTDGGATWSPLSQGLSASPLDLRAVVVHPQSPTTLFLTAGGATALYKSTNGGASWTTASSNLPGIPTGLGFHPSQPQILYAGTYSGLYRSTNGGSSWSLLPATVGRAVLSVANSPGDATRILVGLTDNGVLISEDAGATWLARSSGLRGLTVSSLAAAPTGEGSLYAATEGGQLLRTTDGGASWEVLNPAMATTGTSLGSVTALAVDPKVPTTIYVGGESGLFKSTTRGESWSLIGPSDPSFVGFSTQALAVDPQTPANLYLAGIRFERGLWRSVNGGASWTLATSGLSDTEVRALAVVPTAPSTLYAGTLSALFRSTNGAQSWSALSVGMPGGDGVDQITISPIDGDRIYIRRSALIYISSDGGTSWEARDVPTACVSVHDLVASPSLAAGVRVACSAGVFASTDAGESWSVEGEGWPDDVVATRIAHVPGAPGLIFAGGRAASVFAQQASGAGPQIIAQPVGQTISAGQTAVISVRVSGEGPLSYQWYRGPSGDTSNPVAGATSAALLTPPLAADAAYWVRVTNEVGAADSRSAPIRVLASAPKPQPQAFIPLVVR